MSTDATSQRQPISLIPPGHREIILYIILILLAAATRFYHLGDRVISHDESLHTYYAWQLVAQGTYVHDPMTHGPLKFHATALAYRMLGDNDATSRVPAALCGVVAIGLLYFFRGYLGRTGALVAAFLMLISPHMLYFSRYIRDEAFVSVWGLLLALFVINYMRSRKTGYLYGLAAIMALFFATMETFFIYTAIVILFLSFFLAAELAFTGPWPNDTCRMRFRVSAGISLAAAGILALTVLLKGNATTPAVALAGGYVFCIIFALRGFGNGIRRFPAIDLLAVLWVFVLPQLTALAVHFAGLTPAFKPLGHYTPEDIAATANATAILLLLSAGIGLVWDWRKFLACAGVFYGISVPLFTNFFRNGNGLHTGFVGSLGYWLVQHKVGRGGQPWYYYSVFQLVLYEVLPVAGALLALWYGVKKNRNEPGTPVGAPVFPAIGFLGFWALSSLIFFSIASERMPWLAVHITLPLILLSGWSIGRLIDTTVIGWRAVLRVSVLAFLGLLAAVTVRAAFRAAYINYDDPREYLAYAHGAPGARVVADRIERISRLSGGAHMPIACDNSTSWPMAWYLRRYPNTLYYTSPALPAVINQAVVIAGSGSWSKMEPKLGDRYTSSEHIRLVWPVQDYIHFSLASAVRPLFKKEYRRALRDIWLDRDYTRYGKLPGKSYEPANWPVADRMRLYVRKDIGE